MSTLNISLPESMKAFVEEQVAHGGFSTASEYVRQLVREDQKRLAEKRLQTLLLEGLDSGLPVEVSPSWWQQKKAELLQHLRGKEGQ